MRLKLSIDNFQTNIMARYLAHVPRIAPSGPFYWHDLTLIPAWINNHTSSKKWDEITYPFLNFNGVAVEV